MENIPKEAWALGCMVVAFITVALCSPWRAIRGNNYRNSNNSTKS